MTGGLWPSPQFIKEPQGVEAELGRSVLYDRLRWLLHERPHGVVIGYVHRAPGLGSIIKEISLERVKSASKWALLLDDDWTVIPLHRIRYIKSVDGGKVFYEKKNSGG